MSGTLQSGFRSLPRCCLSSASETPSIVTIIFTAVGPTALDRWPMRRSWGRYIVSRWGHQKCLRQYQGIASEPEGRICGYCGVTVCCAESPQQGVFFCGERKGDGRGQSREGRDLG